MLVSLGRGDEALTLLDRARKQGDMQANFRATGQLAEALLRMDRDDVNAARALYAELHPPERTRLAPWHAHMVSILAARIARAEGRLAEARAILDRAIEASGYPATLSAAQPELLEYAARLSLEIGDFETAVQRSREAIRVADLQFGHDVANAHAGRARLTLATALASKGSAREARTELEPAVAASRRPPAPHTLGR